MFRQLFVWSNNASAFENKGPLTPWDHGFSETEHSSSQLPEHFIWKRKTDIFLAPRGAAEPQWQVVQGGGQLPGDRGVGQGRAAGKHGPLTAACFLTC